MFNCGFDVNVPDIVRQVFSAIATIRTAVLVVCHFCDGPT